MKILIQMRNWSYHFHFCLREMENHFRILIIFHFSPADIHLPFTFKFNIFPIISVIHYEKCVPSLAALENIEKHSSSREGNQIQQKRAENYSNGLLMFPFSDWIFIPQR